MAENWGKDCKGNHQRLRAILKFGVCTMEIEDREDLAGFQWGRGAVFPLSARGSYLPFFLPRQHQIPGSRKPVWDKDQLILFID